VEAWQLLEHANRLHSGAGRGMLTLFQEPFSHWCVKTQKILNYKHVKFESKNVGYYDKRELIKATGQDYVPAIVHEGKIVTYPDIPDYLERLSPDPTIYPSGARDLAKLIENWAHYRLEDTVWRYCVVDFPKTFKDDLERWVFVEIQEIKRGPLELMAARRPTFKADMEAHFQIMDRMLHNHKFLIAEAPSLADFATFGAVYPLRYSGNEIPREFKHLQSWYDTIDRI
jgi:glutathione S-transferase